MSARKHRNRMIRVFILANTPFIEPTPRYHYLLNRQLTKDVTPQQGRVTGSFTDNETFHRETRKLVKSGCLKRKTHRRWSTSRQTYTEYHAS